MTHESNASERGGEGGTRQWRKVRSLAKYSFGSRGAEVAKGSEDI